MNNIKEIWDSLVDRVRNPLLTGFAISWCVINYKFLLVIFAEEHYSKKFDFIENTLYADSEIALWRLVGGPVLFSAFYIFILPGVEILSTWAGSTYERLHSNVRVRALQNLTITTEQRDEIKKETALLIEKAQKEAQDAITARIDTSRITRENVTKLFNILLPKLFESLSRSPDWKGPVKKREHVRTVAGTDEQNEFLFEHGIPEKWAEIFIVMRADNSTRISTIEAAKRLGVSEEEALSILVNLCALAMFDLDWIDNAPNFVMKESPWVALLNGRPA